MTEQSICRLENFISIARKGEKVDLTVVLNRLIFTRQFAPYTMANPEDQIDIYMLSADYLFVVAGETKKVTKYYISGIEGESLVATKNNISIANERLQMDYDRLRKAQIVFLEKFWD